MIKIKSLFKCLVDYIVIVQLPIDLLVTISSTSGNAKCDVGLCQFTVGDNV